MTCAIGWRCACEHIHRPYLFSKLMVNLSTKLSILKMCCANAMAKSNIETLANDDERLLQLARARVYLFFFVFGIKHDNDNSNSNTSHSWHGKSCCKCMPRTTLDFSRLAAYQTTVLCQQSCHFYFVVFVYFLPDTKAHKTHFGQVKI